MPGNGNQRREAIRVSAAHSAMTRTASAAAKGSAAALASVRQAIARLWTFAETGRWTAARGRAEAARGGGGSAASIGKVAQTRIIKQAGVRAQ